MSTTERQQRVHEATRSTILDAARRIARHDGAGAVTIRGIADKVDYSPAAIYRYFPDKAAILTAVASADHEALARELQATGDIPDPMERIRRLIRTYVEFGLQNLDRYREMFAPPVDATDQLTRPISAATTPNAPAVDQAYAVLRRAIAHGVMALRFRPEIADVDLLTQLIWSGVHGLLALHAARTRDSDIPWRPARQSAALMTDALLRGLARVRPV
ncbi:MAG: TetR/AcrR family transcriptional regulator [Gemmatimonadaceae bacterium]